MKYVPVVKPLLSGHPQKIANWPLNGGDHFNNKGQVYSKSVNLSESDRLIESDHIEVWLYLVLT